MKKYIILESWHNGCDNAKDENYATCDRHDNADEIITGTMSAILRLKSLGKGFPAPTKENWIHTEWDKEKQTMRIWIGKTGQGFFDSEFRREFKIIENNQAP